MGGGVEIKNHKQSGYTLVELIVVGMMFSILTIAAYNLFDNQSKINRTQQNYVEMQSSARAAMQILIKDFSHAGFGCVDSFNVGRTLNGSNTFLIPSIATFQAPGSTPDDVTIVYGHQHVGTVTQNANATNLITADATDIAAAQGDQYRRHIAFYPYTDPNSFFIGTGSNGNNITITLDREIESIKSGAKIFRVTPIRYFVDTNSSELRITPTLNLGSEETLIYDVQDFQLAYSIDGETWLEAPTLNQSRNVKIIWAYLLIRSREQEPGFQESRNFTLPWNSAQVQGPNLPSGFHYYELHAQIWLRNVL
jgi:type IV pilus assembly protein PilW